MKIKRFFAADIRQAMKMVKDELGADAVIMSNRAVEGGIEIVAARDFDEQAITNKLQEQSSAQGPEPQAPQAKKITLPTFEEAKKKFHLLDSQKKTEAAKKPEVADGPKLTENSETIDKKETQATEIKPNVLGSKRVVLPNFDAARKRIQLENERKNAAALALANAQNNRKFTSPYVGYAEKIQLGKNPEQVQMPEKVTPAPLQDSIKHPSVQDKPSNASDALLMEMSKELKYLRNVMDTKLANINVAQTTAGRSDIQQDLTKLGLSKKLATFIASRVSGETDANAAFGAAQDILAQSLPIANDHLLESGGIVALVGPTGVGKTTTIAKLAAKFILKHGSSQVALITTDNYRIGAHEQLNTYGRILNVPVRVASCADDLRHIIQGFANKRLILIDTAGMCQRDMKLVEQINTLQQNDLPIRSYLVMSAATEYWAMNSIIKAFSVFEPQAAILTKLDESVMVGSAVSAIIEHNLPISFITDGQQVPEDFHCPDAQSLIAQCMAAASEEADLSEGNGYSPWGTQVYA